MITHNTDDPLDHALKPPPDETLEQRNLRLAHEEEAKRISLAIDASIKAERHARKKKRIVRLLLLGQSESGKSTTLRQFQRLYTPTAFREERILWRAVIQLNVVRSIRIILETLASAMSPMSPATSPSSSPRRRARTISRPPRIPEHRPSHSWSNSSHSSSDFRDGETTNTRGTAADSGPESDMDLHESRSNKSSVTLNMTPLEALKSRLQPLRHIEQLLVAKLVPPNEDEATQLAGPSHPIYPSNNPQNHGAVNSFRNQEVFIRSGAAWRGALSKARVNNLSVSDNDTLLYGNVRPYSAGNAGLETVDEPQKVLHLCQKDLILLWNDQVVREILRRKKVRLEEFPGFFLNDLKRITSLKYMPSDTDVLKARLKTVGVSEYKFEMEVAAGRDSGTEWRIVDVGGSRSQVRCHTWCFYISTHRTP